MYRVRRNPFWLQVPVDIRSSTLVGQFAQRRSNSRGMLFARGVSFAWRMPFRRHWITDADGSAVILRFVSIYARGKRVKYKRKNSTAAIA